GADQAVAVAVAELDGDVFEQRLGAELHRDVGGGNQGGSPAECTGAKRGGLYALPPVNAAGSEVPGQPVEELILGGQQPIGPEQLMQNHDAPERRQEAQLAGLVDRKSVV